MLNLQNYRKHVRSSLLIAFIATTILGCENPNKFKDVSNPQVEQYHNQSRISIIMIDKVYDDMAYEDERGIYLIKDSQTNKEFIGISGIGISELGSHSSGKTRSPDER